MPWQVEPPDEMETPPKRSSSAIAIADPETSTQSLPNLDKKVRSKKEIINDPTVNVHAWKKQGL